MPPESQSYHSDWVRIAEKDWGRAQKLLAEGDFEAAGFFLQQAMEKYLKAYLLSHGWTLKRIHDLEILLNDALPFDASLEEFRSLCQIASGFYMIERYPFPGSPGISDEDVRDCMSDAKRLVGRLKSQLP